MWRYRARCSSARPLRIRSLGQSSLPCRSCGRHSRKQKGAKICDPLLCETSTSEGECVSARAGAPGAPLRAARRRAGSSRRALSPAGERKVGAMVPELLAEPIHGRNLAWFANITCGGTIDEWCEGASLSGAVARRASRAPPSRKPGVADLSRSSLHRARSQHEGRVRCELR